jgi:hypothetical protein
MEVIDNVIQAYEAVKLNDVSKGIIALCTFVAIIIVIQKFVTAWKEAFSEGDRPADMKQFFKLFYIYIYVFAIIMAAGTVIPGLDGKQITQSLFWIVRADG